jgi:uncharacterized protein YjdB
MHSASLRSVFIAASVLLAACTSSDSAPVGSSTPAESRLFLVLSSTVDTVPEATSKPVVARVTDAQGVLKSAPISWLSTDPAVATVSGGLIAGVAPGHAKVIASTTGTADTVDIVVTPNELSLDVQPSAAAIAMGDSLQFVATVRTRAGDVISVNRFTWSSSDSSAVNFVGAGAIQTLQEGRVTISAEALRRRGESEVQVFRLTVASVSISPSTANLYQGDSLKLEVTLRDGNGREIRNGEVTFGSSDFTKATVTQDGVVVGKAAGSVVITATSGTKTASATVNVLSTAATSLSLVLSSDTALIGLDLQAVAVSLDAEGDTLTGRTIAWQSANSSVATISSTGVIKGLVEGSTNISAISDGIVATRKVSVHARQAASIQIQPGAPSVMVGQSAQLVAQVLDQDGVEITGQTVTWTSSNAGVATVSPSGLLTGDSAGSVLISATSGSNSVTASATVTNVQVASVQVSPASVTLDVGKQAALSATALGSNGTVLTGRPATWTSLNTSVATVSASGVVTAIAGGSATVRATIEGQSATASITVTAPPAAAVATVIVALGSTALNPGEQTTATAILKDAQGNTLSGKSVTWSSLDTAVAKVSQGGLVTTYAGGTVAIIATSEGVSGAASLTVGTPSPEPVAVVWIEVPTQDIMVGESVQTIVTLKDANGNVLTGRTITYTTDNPMVVSVSASGVVKGVGEGTTKIRVSSGGITATETFRVTAPPSSGSGIIASITASAPQTALATGQATQATAVAKDAQGNTVSTIFTWTTSAPGVATVSSSGVVTAVGGGSATITAAASGVTGSFGVTVSTSSTSPVASVTVSLASSGILVGQTSQASFVAKDAQGNVVGGRPVTWSSAVAWVATVNSSGVASGVASGTATISATVDGVTGGSNLTVSSSTLPPPGSSIAELPRVYLNFPYPAKTGQTITVGPGGNLQNALNSAQRGDEIVLTAGATYSGNFTLPAKSGTAADGWITIRSDKLSSLPPIGTRVSSSHASLMPRIVTPNTAAAIRTAAGASGWRLAGLEVSVASSVTSLQYGIVWLGESGSSQSTLASVPSDLVLDRMYIHGLSTTNTVRCVALNSARSQVSDSYISECHAKGFDSQAIWGGNGPGPFKIVNNMLQAAGENIMFGGSDPAISGLIPGDIEIRQNYIYSPVSWKGIWTKKNLLETKNAVRMLIEGNVLDGSWQDAQTGWAIILKSANQSGGCRWCRTTDVTVRRNLIRNAGAGINVAPKGDLGNVDTTARRIHISENVLENIGVAPYTGDQRGFQLLGGTAYITLERNVLAGNLSAAMMLDKSPGSTGDSFRENVWARGQYGVIATGASPGSASLDIGAPGYAWSSMTLVGGTQSGYPSGTTFVSSESSASLAAQIRGIVSQATLGVVIP